jgi:hypothetical protein
VQLGLHCNVCDMPVQQAVTESLSVLSDTYHIFVVIMARLNGPLTNGDLSQKVMMRHVHRVRSCAILWRCPSTMICSSPPQKEVNHAITDSKPSVGVLHGARDTTDITLVARLANISSSATSPHERQVPCIPDALSG